MCDHPRVAEIEQALGTHRVRHDVSLAHLTTFRAGGRARLFFEARTPDELAAAVSVARRSGIDHFVLGTGANILIGDGGFPGLVIRNNAAAVMLDRAHGELTAHSGALMYPDVIETAVRAGWSGLEHYVGIPSTVGGALWQNLHFLAPARERTVFIAEVLAHADLLTEEGERRRVPVEYFRFGYDQSILHRRRDIVLSAMFKLSRKRAQEMRKVTASNLAWRQARHPPLDSEPSAGSIFRKIEGVGAGRLIDGCGLKGMIVGDAQVSHRHANIIVNRGAATARDIRELIHRVQSTVACETGYRLIPEIAFIGDFAF